MRSCVLIFAIALVFGGCMRENKISGPESERYASESFAWFAMGALFTNEEGKPQFFAYRPAYETPLRLYRYDDAKANYVGPVFLELFENERAGANHLIGVYENEQGVFVYFGADYSDIAANDGGLLRIYLTGLGALENATNWMEISSKHQSAANSTTFKFVARLATAAERESIVRAALPAGVNAPETGKDPPSAPSADNNRQMSSKEIEAEIAKIDKNIERIKGDVKGWCNELRELCGGRICDKTEDGRRMYQSVRGEIWYFEDGSVAPRELWKDDYSTCYD